MPVSSQGFQHSLSMLNSVLKEFVAKRNGYIILLIQSGREPEEGSIKQNINEDAN
jgi:hypothetical protein